MDTLVTGRVPKIWYLCYYPHTSPHPLSQNDILDREFSANIVDDSKTLTTMENCTRKREKKKQEKKKKNIVLL